MIPIYLKTDTDMPRPADDQFYLVTASGIFMGRSHPFFRCDIPVSTPPRALQPHQPWCDVDYPKLGVTALEYIVGFFSHVFRESGGESIVLLYWNQKRQRYKLHVPKQEATVWESSGGTRTALDVRYEVPTQMSAEYLLVADIHCHCDFGAESSHTDHKDEFHRDGVHAIVGHIERDLPEFYAQISIAGTRFRIRFDQFFRGYPRHRRNPPTKWLEQVRVKVNRPQSWQYGNSQATHTTWRQEQPMYKDKWNDPA